MHASVERDRKADLAIIVKRNEERGRGFDEEQAMI